MSGVPRRPPLIGVHRSSARPPVFDILDCPTVINASALPRSMSYNTTSALAAAAAAAAATSTTSTMVASASTSASALAAFAGDRNDDVPPSPDNKMFKAAAESASIPLGKDSLARDPFVAISRAIHNAKLRAAASIRTNSGPVTPANKHHARLARYRAFCIAFRRSWRPLIFLILSLIFMYILQLLYSSWPSFLSSSSRSSLSFSAHGSRTLSSLDVMQKHLPSAYRSRKLSTGPWLVALVADLDRESCQRRDGAGDTLRPTPCTTANVWVSYLKRGILTLTPGTSTPFGSNATSSSSSTSADTVSHSGRTGAGGTDGAAVATVEWVDERVLEEGRPAAGAKARGNRGMELSELEWFHGRLVAPDDRTGAVVEIVSPYGGLTSRAAALLPAGSSQVPPGVRRRTMLADGAGKVAEAPFKGEWMVVKDDVLVIGGHGRPYTAVGDGAHVVSLGPKWIKVVDEGLRVAHTNWSDAYDAVASAMGVQWPGYVMHEAVLWSPERREWVFLPRRRSREVFDAERNQRMGWNVVVVGNEDLSQLRRVTVEGLRDESGTRGFSSAKFVPGSEDRLVAAVRTVEVETSSGETWMRKTASFLSVFDLRSGEMVMEETKVSDKKYEGLVFM